MRRNTKQQNTKKNTKSDELNVYKYKRLPYYKILK